MDFKQNQKKDKKQQYKGSKREFRNKKESGDVKLSKSLSFILRHGALKDGLNMGRDFYVKLDELLQHRNFKNYTLSDIQLVVDENNKDRFQLEEREGEYYIRARQGHSISFGEEGDQLLLTPITDSQKYDMIVHGTYRKAWNLIKESGLNKMERNHVHFAKGLNVISGVRSSCEVFVELDLEKCLKDGIKFYESGNGVILSPGVDGLISTNYFKKAWDVNGKELTWTFKPQQNEQKELIEEYKQYNEIE